MEGVGLIKLKLKKMGGLDRLRDGLQQIRILGMEPVLGDRVSADVACWMEACVARSTITYAGEFNGFLKPSAQLFADPMDFREGALHLQAGFTPEMDREVLATHTIARERLTSNPKFRTSKGLPAGVSPDTSLPHSS